MIMGNLIKTLLTKSILPLTYIGILVFVLFAIKNRYDPELMNYLMTVAAFGLPIGIFKMFVWVVPFGYGAGETLAFIVLDLAVGAVIGVFMLCFITVRGLVYIPISFYRYFAEKKAEKNFFLAKIVF